MIRKLALRIAVPMLLAVVALNAYLAASHLGKAQEMDGLISEMSAIQRNISAVVQGLTDMETSQRGYLLTGDKSHLQPYSDAKGTVGTAFTEFRVRFTTRSQEEKSLESQLESLAGSKQFEMERSIDLRQRGYRHRAFALVATDEGNGYMDEIRRIASTLTSTLNSNLKKLDKNRTAALSRALSVSIVANTGVFLLAGCVFTLICRHTRLLENELSQSRRELGLRDSQLTKLTTALSGQARSEIVAINTTSHLLLENYGDFLPRQGHQYAEQMKEAAIQIERLRQDLVGSLSVEGNGHAA